MLALLQQNLATIVVAAILVCIVVAIVRKTIKDKRNGLWMQLPGLPSRCRLPNRTSCWQNYYSSYSRRLTAPLVFIWRKSLLFFLYLCPP